MALFGAARAAVGAGRLAVGELGDAVEQEAREQLGPLESVVEAKGLLGEASVAGQAEKALHASAIVAASE